MADNHLINPSGLCQCGCGQPAPLASKTCKKRGWIKGQPVRFIFGHQGRMAKHGKNSHSWKNGKVKHGEYIKVKCPGHPRANDRGYVLEHILVAEAKLGRLLEPDEKVHHINGKGNDNHPDNIMVCRDDAHHLGLHARERALKACGNPNWKRCWVCKQWDDPQNMYVDPSGYRAWHRKCVNKYYLERKRKHLRC